MQLNVVGDNISNAEAEMYVEYVKNKFPNRYIEELTVSQVGNEEVDLKWKLVPAKFERIRRITGYLAGDVSSFNNAKQHEEQDRVKHAMSGLEMI